MRYARFIAIACTLPHCGCAAIVASRGVDFDREMTRAGVREELGTPVTSGNSDGQLFDVFRTRRKLSNVFRSSVILHCDVATGGLYEMTAFPHELYILGKQTAFGQDVRVTYGADEKVTKIDRPQPGFFEPTFPYLHYRAFEDDESAPPHSPGPD